MHTVTLDIIRPRLVDWIWRAAVEPFDGRFHFSLDTPSPPILYNTAYATLALECMNALDGTDPAARDAMADYMRSFQTEDGWFVDTDIKYAKGDLSNLGAKCDYTRWHLTFCTLEALDALNKDPARPLEFLEDFASSGKVNRWLGTLDMSRSWAESNKIMSLLGFYFFAYDRDGQRQWLDLASGILEWLEAIQDPATGLWGADRGASLIDAMAGTYHYLMFFYALDRPVPYRERIIDSVLKLQVRRGNFAPCGGSSCIDLDAFDMLVNLSRYTDYRLADIRDSAVRIYHAVAALHNEDGGFAETDGRLFGLGDAVDLVAGLFLRYRCLGTFKEFLKYPVKTKCLPGHHFNAGGIDQEASPWPASNMWSAWFRPLVMVEASDRFGEVLPTPKTFTPKFRRLPGLGYKAAPFVRK